MADERVPTSEGYYWWAPAGNPDVFVIEVRERPANPDGSGEVLVAFDKGGWPRTLAAFGGTWGARVPGSGQIEAMREVCDETPWEHRGGWSGHEECRYCGHSYTKQRAHEDDCSWLRAQDPERSE